MTNPTHLECRSCGSKLSSTQSECGYCGTPNKYYITPIVNKVKVQQSIVKSETQDKTQLLILKNQLLEQQKILKHRKKKNVIMMCCLFWLYYIPLIIGIVNLVKINKELVSIEKELIRINTSLAH